MDGWVGGVCYCSIRLSQPSLAGVKAGAELGKKDVTNLECVNTLQYK